MYSRDTQSGEKKFEKNWNNCSETILYERKCSLGLNISKFQVKTNTLGMPDVHGLLNVCSGREVSKERFVCVVKKLK